MLIEYTDPQGSDAWLQSRRGVITGSRFAVARERVGLLDERQSAYVAMVQAGETRQSAATAAGYKRIPSAAAVVEALAGGCTSAPSATAISYAKDLARERCGVLTLPAHQTLAMRIGSEQEDAVRCAYEVETGLMVTQCGFFATQDHQFGVSPDGLVGDDGLIEIKTMVSSETLFRCVVDGISADYIDQINGELWLLNRQWCDLVLWAPDLAGIGRALTVRRIHRNEDAINELVRDLMEFAGIVNNYTAALRGPDEE